MQIVIEISDDDYQFIKDTEFENYVVTKHLYEAVYKGTPLPKGHGRLGDLDVLEKLCIEHDIGNSAFDNSPMIEQGHYSDGDCIWKPLFDFAPTIIEADKESECV